MGFADHFSAQAAAYAAHRPSYPPALASYLASIAPGRALAWDCGTGSGQAAVGLAAEFAHVVATDPSAAQLAHAQPHPRVEYRVGQDRSSGLANGSCDLVTAAQAAHWFDLPAFYAEARRVLRPAGVIAVWCYPRFQISPAIDRVLDWFEHERVGPYWPAGREYVDAEYRTLPFPFPRLSPPPFGMTTRWDRDAVLANADTWSAVARCRRAEGRDPLPELAARLEPEWPNRHNVLNVHWALHMLVGRVGAEG